MALELSTKNKQLTALDAAIWVGREIKNRGVVPKESDFQKVYPKVLLNDVLFLISNVGGVPFSPPTQLVQKIDQVLAKLETLKQTIEGHPEGYGSFDTKSIPQQVLTNPQFLGLSTQDARNELEAARLKMVEAQYEAFWLGREEATLLGAAIQDEDSLKELWGRTVVPPTVTTAAGAFAITNPAMAIFALPAIAFGAKPYFKIKSTLKNFQTRSLYFTTPAQVLEFKYRQAWKRATFALPKALLFRTRYFTTPFGKSYPYKDFWPTEVLGQGVAKFAGGLASVGELVHKKVFKGNPTVWKEVSQKVSENLKPYYWDKNIKRPEKRKRGGPWGVVVGIVVADVAGTIAGRIVQIAAKKVLSQARLASLGKTFETTGFVTKNVGGGVFSLNTAAGFLLGTAIGGPPVGFLLGGAGATYQIFKNLGQSVPKLPWAKDIAVREAWIKEFGAGWTPEYLAQAKPKLNLFQKLFLRPSSFLSEANQLRSLRAGITTRLPLKGFALGLLIPGGGPILALELAGAQLAWSSANYLPGFAARKFFGVEVANTVELAQFFTYKGLTKIPLWPFAGVKNLSWEQWLKGAGVGGKLRVHWTRNLVSGTKGGVIGTAVTLPFVFFGLAPVWLPFVAFGSVTALNFGWNAFKNRFFPAKAAPAAGKIGVLGVAGRAGGGIGNIWAGLTGLETGTVLGFNLSQLPIPGWMAKVLTVAINYGLTYAGVAAIAGILVAAGIFATVPALVIAAIAGVIIAVDLIFYKLTGKGLFGWVWEGIKFQYGLYSKLPTWAQVVLSPAFPVFALFKFLPWILKGALGLLSKIPLVGGFFGGVTDALFGAAKAAVSAILGLLGAIISLLTGGDIAEAAVAGAIGLVMAGALINSQTIESAFFQPLEAPELGAPVSPYLRVEKSVSPQGQVSSLPQDLIFTVVVTALQQQITELKVTDSLTVRTGSGSFNPTQDSAGRPISPIPCPSTLEAGQNCSYSFTITATAPTYKDSLVINQATAEGSVSIGPGIPSKQTSSASVSVIIGNPPIDTPNGWPTNGNITQGPNGPPSSHAGEAIDIAGGLGVPVYSTFNATVTLFKTDLCGLGIELAPEDNSFQVSYCHLNNRTVNSGDRVTWGQLIGTQGHSGDVKPPGPGGTHLHYAFRGLDMAEPLVPVTVPDGCSKGISDCGIRIDAAPCTSSSPPCTNRTNP